ncbi:MAG: 50S ribosomal protein L19e [Candidatus Aenigmatarchaeota archaeon]
MSKQSRTANSQRRIASKILKAGSSRVWMDPNQAAKISQAITRTDIRRLIDKGIIRELPERKPTPEAGARKQDIGSRKGARGARLRGGKKEPWLNIIRPQRQMLNELKPSLKPMAYRKLYRLVKGGAFRSRTHLKSYVEEKKLLNK